MSALRRFAALAILAASLTLGVAAKADVVFNWVNLDPYGCCHGSVVVADDILSAPISISFTGADPAYTSDNTIPITSLSFGWESADPAVTAGFWLSAPHADGRRDPCSYCRWTFNIALEGDRLVGSIAQQADTIEGAISSAGDIWNFSISTENPYADPACRNYPGCSGTLRGYFQIGRGPQPVPEPFSAALLVVGFAGLLYRARRKSPSAEMRRT